MTNIEQPTTVIDDPAGTAGAETGAVPTGTAPSGTVPTGAAPTGAAPTGAVPTAPTTPLTETVGGIPVQQMPGGYGFAGAAAGPASSPAAPARKPDSAFAIASFVLGIASVVSSWTFVAPIIGLVLGILSLRRGTNERTLAIWGVCLNGAMLALTALIALGLVTVAGIGFLANLSSWGGIG